MRKASEKQVAFIEKLLKRREWNESVSVAELSVESASELIEKLLKAPKNISELKKAQLEQYRKLREQQEREEEIERQRQQVELENCERCKNPAAGPGHFSCLYGGGRIGHSRQHCSADACF
jgi:hypothetical protein